MYQLVNCLERLMECFKELCNESASHSGSINTSSFFRSAEGMEAVETGIHFGIFGYELESRNHFLGLVC